ncbi:LacI family DNA-binding transcriptional regulator [Niabella soli]|uniref:LacI family transcription regulator n=1 Tax=Niabella soli DSM 19437 TaxID=929713 RepID=W0EUR4_9BACT|nr:LacI family DNA-binding transcriptional regulator [Niabella soli]AHF14550.1 LacI family transcription regulator [Niabella soli DSM 19437]
MSASIPTIKEIAKRLNVSVSTVSRALSDHPRISEKTKEAVKELAKALHYEPNSKAIFFKQKKSYVIGVIVPLIYEDFFSKGISGIEAIAMDNGYTILFGQSYDSIDKEKQVVDAMKSQRVDGLIISLSKETNKNDHLKVLDAYNIPIVYFDRVPSTANVNKVYSNLFEGTVNMIEWLFKKGRKRIAFINGPAALIASKERLDGYIEGISRRKLKVDMQMVEQTDFSELGTHQAITRLLSLKKPPDAIISFNDYVHMDAVKCALSNGIKINEEILFASYANISVNKHTAFPPVVSVDQFPYKQGEAAMKMMMHILNHKNEAAELPTPVFQNMQMEAVLVFN